MCVLSHVQLFAPWWTEAHQVSMSMEFFRQEYWNGLPFPPARDLANPGIKPMSPVSPAVGGEFCATSTTCEVQISLETSLKHYLKPMLCFHSSLIGYGKPKFLGPSVPHKCWFFVYKHKSFLLWPRLRSHFCETSVTWIKISFSSVHLSCINFGIIASIRTHKG